MPGLSTATDPADVIRRLRDVTNAHDIDGIVACFAPDYRNATPLHPARDFVGSDQVRRNWTQILAAIPDVSCEVVASVTAGQTVWTEWEHRGTRPDHTAHLMRGVIIFGVRDELIVTARFYLEPVDEVGSGIDEAVRSQTQARETP